MPLHVRPARPFGGKNGAASELWARKERDCSSGPFDKVVRSAGSVDGPHTQQTPCPSGAISVSPGMIKHSILFGCQSGEGFRWRSRALTWGIGEEGVLEFGEMLGNGCHCAVSRTGPF
jgi:hypothetical protein